MVNGAKVANLLAQFNMTDVAVCNVEVYAHYYGRIFVMSFGNYCGCMPHKYDIRYYDPETWETEFDFYDVDGRGMIPKATIDAVQVSFRMEKIGWNYIMQCDDVANQDGFNRFIVGKPKSWPFDHEVRLTEEESKSIHCAADVIKLHEAIDESRYAFVGSDTTPAVVLKIGKDSPWAQLRARYASFFRNI